MLFDGKCPMCTGWVRFIMLMMHSNELMIATMQGKTGQELLARYDFPLIDLGSNLYINSDGEPYTKSDAFIAVLSHLRWPWPILRAVRFIPRPLRDRIYDVIADNRYRVFGAKEECYLLSEEENEQFIL